MRDKNAVDEENESETNSETKSWRPRPSESDPAGDDAGVEKKLREDADEELHATMSKAFSRPVPRSSDPTTARAELLNERVRKGDASAADALRFDGDEGDELEARIEDAGPEELLRVLVEEVRANREALEILAAGDEGKDKTPWTM